MIKVVKTREEFDKADIPWNKFTKSVQGYLNQEEIYRKYQYIVYNKESEHHYFLQTPEGDLEMVGE